MIYYTDPKNKISCLYCVCDIFSAVEHECRVKTETDLKFSLHDN